MHPSTLRGLFAYCARQTGWVCKGKRAMWTKPEAVEIKMDAEISSYQDDSYDPLKDGPLFVQSESVSDDDDA